MVTTTMPTATKPKKTPKRVRRSICFTFEDHERLKAEAKSLDRSVNWVVNQLVRKDLKSV